MGQSGKQVYITAVTNDKYFIGLKVLLKTLRQVETKRPLYVMVPNTMDAELCNRIIKLGVKLIQCPPIVLPENAAALNSSPAWNETFFKLNVMQLTQFEKIIFIDADMIVLNNIDHLFNCPSISATTGGKAAHPEWVEFNSGLMVISPNESEFQELVNCIPAAIKRKTEMGLGYGDQDVFNEWYPEWKTLEDHHLDETYNAELGFIDALMNSKNMSNLNELYVIHYIGGTKIWNKSIIRIAQEIHGSIHDHHPFDAKAILLFLKKRYF